MTGCKRLVKLEESTGYKALTLLQVQLEKSYYGPYLEKTTPLWTAPSKSERKTSCMAPTLNVNRANSLLDTPAWVCVPQTGLHLVFNSS